MKRISLFIIAMSVLISLIGCDSNEHRSLKDYDDSDVAAIVRDKEITIGEMRFLYADEEVLSSIDDAVRMELMIQEAKKMNTDVPDKIDSMRKTWETMSLDDIEMENSQRSFIKSQARKLGMEPEEYFKEWIEITSVRSLYIMEYTQKAVRQLEASNDEELAAYNKEVSEHLDELVKGNEKDIKILIR
ncbi:hypothetical protein NCCP2222_27730 [Sporosarcina sp. NCCP-2222]|uniref:hypothetical protein n=1 Tax=Sporosarcina sp. NCCP-2222 TaxID=2935073 RepID=UPI00208638BC|nr:hypothetical protein [Sporosarcina sp. NCCP-2222]GKV56826.1 hypothetical protein NCCP2222_27730 [Sporosarcina sp. NCCP-2222]